MPTLIYAISATAVSVAFPDMISDLNTSVVVAGWTLSAFQLTWVAMVPVAGKITESLGQRTVLIMNVSLFTGGSVLCAIAPDITSLIVFRVIQAAGGAGFMPCATAIISDTFPRSRQRAIGLISSIFPIGMVIGPNLGGWLVEAFGWRSVFWLNIPFGIIVLVMAWFLLSNDRKSTMGKIDFLGASMLAISIFALMFGFTMVSDPESGISWLIPVLSLLAGLALLYIFIRRERKIPEPIFDFALFRQRPVMATNIYNIFYGACALGVVTLVPLYAVSIYGMSTFASGYILTPRSIAMIIASAIASFSLMRCGYHRPILLGTVLIAISLFLLGAEPQGFKIMGYELDVTMVILIIMLISGIGIGTASPAANNASIELVPDKVATLTSVRIVFRQIGSIAGILLSTIVLHLIDDAERAFQILFCGWGLIMILSIITIFFIPASPIPPSPPRQDGK